MTGFAAQLLGEAESRCDPARFAVHVVDRGHRRVQAILAAHLGDGAGSVRGAGPARQHQPRPAAAQRPGEMRGDRALAVVVGPRARPGHHYRQLRGRDVADGEETAVAQGVGDQCALLSGGTFGAAGGVGEERQAEEVAGEAA